jgi:hypothetical protein
MDKLVDSGKSDDPARVIHVASVANVFGWLDTDNFEKHIDGSYDGFMREQQYNTSKLLQEQY